MTLEQRWIVFNLILSITAILLNLEKLKALFQRQSQDKTHWKQVTVTNGNYYQTWDYSKIEVNLDKANKALENKEYEKSIRFLYSAIKINMELDTECNVNLWNRIHEIENKIGL